jgi:hypothetical protein
MLILVHLNCSFACSCKEHYQQIFCAAFFDISYITYTFKMYCVCVLSAHCYISHYFTPQFSPVICLDMSILLRQVYFLSQHGI